MVDVRRVGIAVVPAFVVLLAGCGASEPWPSFRSDAAPTTSRRPLPKRPAVTATAGPSRLVVKLADSLAARVDDEGALVSLASADAGAHADLEWIDLLRRGHGLSFTPLFDLDPARIDALLERAAARSGRAQPDLHAMFIVTTTGGDTPSRDIAAMLHAQAEIEFAVYESLVVTPPEDIAPVTPDFVSEQLYLGSDPGLDVAGAWAMGYDGTGIRLADIELAWHTEHEEWNDGGFSMEPGQTPSVDSLEFVDHGSSVAGQLIAGNNGYGLTGMAYGSTLMAFPEWSEQNGSRRAAAILSAADTFEAGDVILLEMQVTEPILGDLGPAEIDESVWLATQVATDAGLIVVAAAGNGSLDLDVRELAYYRDRGDSGAIMVGGGIPVSRDTYDYSTYGTRVNVQGWGSNVFTAGYGDFEELGDDPNQRYTATFAGTSSASPFIAAASALVQQAVLGEGLEPLTSTQMRAVLIATGLPQGGGGHIGPLPQVPAAIAVALGPHDAPPDVAITTPSSTQTPDRLFETAVDVATSADVMRVELSINGQVQPLVDEAAPFGFGAVQFPPGDWELVAIATNVWGVVAESEPVLLEVGYEPPASTATSAADGASSDDADDLDDADDTAADSSTGDVEDDDDGTVGDGTTTVGATPGGDAGGCGCTTTSPPRVTWWCAALLLGGTRRRRSPMRHRDG